MLKFLGKIVARQHSRRFAQQLHMVQVLLYQELEREYQRDFDVKLSGVLAAQVVNYLTGEELDRSYARVDEATKSKIRQIRDQIVQRADEKMLRDRMVRETIVYTHRMKMVLSFGSHGPQYLQSVDKERSEQILLKYGPNSRRT